jgi:hypothetical protein
MEYLRRITNYSIPTELYKHEPEGRKEGKSKDNYAYGTETSFKMFTITFIYKCDQSQGKEP